MNIQPQELESIRSERAKTIADAGGLNEAIQSGALSKYINKTLSEALVLGLLRQKVSRFITVLGHGSTEIGEVLRIYEMAGLVRTYGVRSEVEAAHAATALKWVTDEKAAVITSIGPGAMHAFAGALAPVSNGLGVWFLFGDETTEDEGPNMQQVPGDSQHSFLKMFSTMGTSYCLHTPNSLQTALRRGLNTVDHPHRGGPFFLLLPLNTQPSQMNNFNLDELPESQPPAIGEAFGNELYETAVTKLFDAEKVVVKLGGGSRKAGKEILKFLELADGVAVTSPLVSGIIPYNHPRNMTVGGSKGSISGNYAMENADLLVAIGSRFVCQSDSSRTGYPKVNQVININTDLDSATHYGKTISLLGDCTLTLKRLNKELRKRSIPKIISNWFEECREKKEEWDNFKKERYNKPVLYDAMWGKDVLTQPAAIKIAADWARKNKVVSFFDAGDVQANGFQVVEDDKLGLTFTETGASYMGFAASALLATAIAQKRFYALAFTGDGSFTMNPQILIDGIAHNARGCILLFDNRRMAAISGLQEAQYGKAYATWDHVPVDYVKWASSVKGVKALRGGNTSKSLVMALNKAKAHRGISLIHLPVYYGPNNLGGLGAFGGWNVGNWVDDTQNKRHKIGL
jgi:3D-(3,5/4)-trihydroxycyclohexane-1,2-dione acylhydrolase (decyclizing)